MRVENDTGSSLFYTETAKRPGSIEDLEPVLIGFEVMKSRAARTLTHRALEKTILVAFKGGNERFGADLLGILGKQYLVSESFALNGVQLSFDYLVIGKKRRPLRTHKPKIPGFTNIFP